MTVTARKYNPGFLTDDELVASFCVRTDEFESMVETLRECTGSANTHQIVIGPRGSGKTSLLLRVAAEIRRDADLSSRFFPIVFAEESYEVSTAGEFWLECLFRLAGQAPIREDGPDLRLTYDELRQIRDDRTLGERCLGVLQDFADREGKRLVLIVENLNMLFRDIGDDHVGWQLRHTLQTESRIVLLASATSRFDEMDDPEQPLYDLFRRLTLCVLDTEDCGILWHAVSGRQRAPQTIRALRILTGGSPRLLTILARFGAELSFRALMDDLLNLVDDHTEYFRSQLETLPAQERKVYLALIHLWKPVTAREIAEWARLETNQCSAQLKRLIERGAVKMVGGTERRKLYYVAERLYNIYYLIRRAGRPDRVIEALIRFMEAYYSVEELRDFGTRMVREAFSLDGDPLGLHRIAFEQLVRLPAMEAYRQELISLAPSTVAQGMADPSSKPAPPSLAGALVKDALTLAETGRLQEAIDRWSSVAGRFGASELVSDLEQVALALVNMGMALARLQRPDEALAAWSEVVERFDSSEMGALPQAVATALVSKGGLLVEQNQPGQALALCDDVVRRFGTAHDKGVRRQVAGALVGKSVALMALDRPDESLSVCDEIVQRFGASKSPDLLSEVAAAMVGRGFALVALIRLDEAMAAWDRVVQRFGDCDVPKIAYQVAVALANIAATLLQLNRPHEALVACEEVVRRFGADGPAITDESVTGAWLNKGNALGLLNRLEEAIAAWDEVERRYRTSGSPALLEPATMALMAKGGALAQTGRFQEALIAWSEVVERAGDSEKTSLLDVAVKSMANKGAVLEHLKRPDEALAIWEQIVKRDWKSEAPEILDIVSGAFLNMAAVLVDLNRAEEALTACDRVLQRFGGNEIPEVRASVAEALVNKGSILWGLDRAEEALDAWKEVVRRFGSSNEPDIYRVVSMALLGKGAALSISGDPEQAMELWEEVVRRNGARTDPESLEAVASALVNKGTVLDRLNRSDEAESVWENVVQRFGQCDLPPLQNAADMALLKMAARKLHDGRVESAVGLVDKVLERENSEFPETGLQGYFLRSRAYLAAGREDSCVKDVETILAILPDLESIPKGVLDDMTWLAIDLGAEKMRDLIQASPSADLLLPLTTALEKELGLEPRVAKEVEEVAEDIRRDLEELRKATSGDDGTSVLDPGSRPG